VGRWQEQRRREGVSSGCEGRGSRSVREVMPGLKSKLNGEDFVIMREEEVLGILVGAGATKKETVGAKR